MANTVFGRDAVGARFDLAHGAPSNCPVWNPGPGEYKQALTKDGTRPLSGPMYKFGRTASGTLSYRKPPTEYISKAREGGEQGVPAAWPDGAAWARCSAGSRAGAAGQALAGSGHLSARGGIPEDAGDPSVLHHPAARHHAVGGRGPSKAHVRPGTHLPAPDGLNPARQAGRLGDIQVRPGPPAVRGRAVFF